MSSHPSDHDAQAGVPPRQSAPSTPPPTGPRRAGAPRGRRRGLGLFAGLAVALSGWTGVTAGAAPLAGAATTLTGTLVIMADGPAGESPYSLTTDDGRSIRLDDPDHNLAGIPAGSRLTVDSGEPVGVPDQGGAPARQAPPASPVSVTVAAAQVLAAAATARPSSLTPAPHTVDVVLFSPNGVDHFLNPAQVQQIVDGASRFWARESRGVTTSITLGLTGTAAYGPAIGPHPCAAGAFSSIMSAGAAGLGVPTSTYWSNGVTNSNRRHLVVLFGDAVMAQWAGNCGTLGTSLVGQDLMSGGPIWVNVAGGNLVEAVDSLAHEFGHNVGLDHGAAISQSCVASKWDGPFDLNTPPANPAACPIGENAYDDWHNIMGSGAGDVLDETGQQELLPATPQDDVIISGHAKAKLGLITPGAGVVTASPTPTDQTITIQQTQTQDRAAPQSIRLAETVPGCGTQIHILDYDPFVGGVRVFRVPDAGDCQTKNIVGFADTVVWMTEAATGRQYLPVGWPRLTQSGQTEITVVSTTATTATIRLHQVGTPPPPVSTLTVSPTELRLPAQGGQQTATITTDQASFTVGADQSGFSYMTQSGPQGKSITIVAGPNNTGVERVVTFTISAGTATATLRVVQPPVGSANATLKLSRTTWNPGKGARSVKVTVTSNQAVQVTQIPSWASQRTCKLKKSGQTQKQTFCLSVQKNTGPARSGVVRFATTANGQTVTADLVITQKGAQRG